MDEYTADSYICDKKDDKYSEKPKYAHDSDGQEDQEKLQKLYSEKRTFSFNELAELFKK